MISACLDCIYVTSVRVEGIVTIPTTVEQLPVLVEDTKHKTLNTYTLQPAKAREIAANVQTLLACVRLYNLEAFVAYKSKVAKAMFLIYIRVSISDSDSLPHVEKQLQTSLKN